VNVVIFSWRDLDHPQAGGAEVYTHHVASGLAARGHSVTLFASKFRGAADCEERAGYRIVRAGSEVSCRLHAGKWLWLNRRSVDVVVDEVNTLPFFSSTIAPDKTILLMFQLAREVWLAEAPWFVRKLGYSFEPIYLRPYRHTPIVTISESSAASLRGIGLSGEIHIVDIAVDDPPPHVKPNPVIGRIGYVGRVTPSKRVDHLIAALPHVCSAVPAAELVIIGRGAPGYLHRLKRQARALGVDDRVTFRGVLGADDRDAAMAMFDVICMTSLREGWGIAITEAGRFGVPSVVYPVNGLIDSTRDGETGLVADECTPEALAHAVIRLIRDRSLRTRVGEGALRFAACFNTDRLTDGIEDVLLRRYNAVVPMHTRRAS